MARDERLVELSYLDMIPRFLHVLASFVLLVRVALLKENGPQIPYIVFDELRSNRSHSDCHTIGTDGSVDVSLFSKQLITGPAKIKERRCLN